MYAFIVLAFFAVVLGVASQLGWSVDSRDGSDWRPTTDGVPCASPRAYRS